MYEIEKNFKFKFTGLYKITIFLDYENPEKGINNQDRNEHFEYEYIEKYLRSLGEVKVMKAYAPFGYYRIAGEELEQYGFELIDTSKTIYQLKKNDKTDPKMIVDMIDIYYSHPEINLFIIISGDIHFLEPLKKIKENPNKKVYVISERKCLNQEYYDYADKVLTYQELKKIFEI